MAYVLDFPLFIYRKLKLTEEAEVMGKVPGWKVNSIFRLNSHFYIVYLRLEKALIIQDRLYNQLLDFKNLYIMVTIKKKI